MEGLIGFEGIGLELADRDSKESQTICLYANYNKIPRRFFQRPQDVPENWVAYGSVVTLIKSN